MFQIMTFYLQINVNYTIKSLEKEEKYCIIYWNETNFLRMTQCDE